MATRLSFLIAFSLVALAGCCHTTSTAPVQRAGSHPAAHTAIAVTRPTVEIGDWVRIAVPLIDHTQPPMVRYARVGRSGNVRLSNAGVLHVAGMTLAAVAKSAVDNYEGDQSVDRANIGLSVVCYQQPGDPLPRPIQPFDLVRVDIPDLAAAGANTVLIGRVTADGMFKMPLVPPVKIAGMDEEDAAKLIPGLYSNFKATASADVTVLEAAPPDAAHRNLPDGPIYPVPDALKPAFDR